ncbi:39S ribosomal protein L19, mitochondrial-like isoform X2 [Agrilus planipennis]|uniref:Large ribosomal subunit protein bL19m n=2 Tax=Agrilus planipennis TaxID=224129 RepID=A0A1W4W2L8_AGRPL|nr:39S ribosomal protein L19, mitochondrial isoform X1 [Agrilus planipennis]XP_025836718.1 39S ribosomal protein L19, mitochondrial-like isoform X1 [Agrilus planipennis]XP_025836719.1 39S ribosomal protein L19, mitochondrial-like isoform X2 [Agrilus planipennis]
MFSSSRKKIISTSLKGFRCNSQTAEALQVTNRLASNKTKPSQLKFSRIYPEFLPDPKIEFRNPLREIIERMDMLNRRRNVHIPEFYVGSILSVTYSDKHNPEKLNCFVGICIKREGCGLRANFILRNIIDSQGIEILFDIYDPTIQRIDVLKLEKRLDDELLYLRDALPEYSTFDINMEAEVLPEGSEIPINPIKVKLKPRPWLERWERKNLKGVQDLELPEKFYKRAAELADTTSQYDLMKQYMKTIPVEEQYQIFSEIESELNQLEIAQKKQKRKKSFVKPVKLA